MLHVKCLYHDLVAAIRTVPSKHGEDLGSFGFAVEVAHAATPIATAAATTGPHCVAIALAHPW